MRNEEQAVNEDEDVQRCRFLPFAGGKVQQGVEAYEFRGYPHNGE